MCSPGLAGAGAAAGGAGAAGGGGMMSGMTMGGIAQMGGGALSAIGAWGEAKAKKNSLLYDAEVNDQNAQLSEWQAQDSIYRGQIDEQTSRLRTASVKGAQRAAMAANGITVGEGSSNDVLTTTDYIGARDALTIKNDAIRSAWGYRVQATNYKDNARNLRRGAKQINPWVSAATSLLGSASSAAASNYLLSKATVGVAVPGATSPAAPGK